MPSSNVVLDIDGPVATVTLARTEAKNALTWEMYDALVEALFKDDLGDVRTVGDAVDLILAASAANA